MKNNYLVFKKVEFNGNLVSNVTDLANFPKIDVKDLELKTIKIDNDMYIEGISYKLWESTDYWDILCVLNNITSINDLPVNNDIVLERVNNRFLEWFNYIKTMYPNISKVKLNSVQKYILESDKELKQELLNSLLEDQKNTKIIEEAQQEFENIKKSEELKNEKFRDIKYVDKDDLSIIISALINNKKEVNINKDILINVKD